MPSPLFFILPLSPTHYRHLRHIVTNRLIVYVFCVTQGVTINSASHGGLTCAVKLRLGVVGAVIGGPPVAIFFTSTPQSRLAPCQLTGRGAFMQQASHECRKAESPVTAVLSYVP